MKSTSVVIFFIAFVLNMVVQYIAYSILFALMVTFITSPAVFAVAYCVVTLAIVWFAFSDYSLHLQNWWSNRVNDLYFFGKRLFSRTA